MNGAIDTDQLLKVEDVARLLQMSAGTIYHLVSQGRIPCVKLSARCLRFRSADLAAWIEDLAHEESRK